MPNEKLYREILNLERKIQLVLNENRKLKEELIQSKEENGSLKSKIETQTAHISDFQNQMKMSKLANNMVVGEVDSAALKEAIDGYIKEIDKCIVHLAE